MWAQEGCKKGLSWRGCSLEQPAGAYTRFVSPFVNLWPFTRCGVISGEVVVVQLSRKVLDTPGASPIISEQYGIPAFLAHPNLDAVSKLSESLVAVHRWHAGRP
jgi:hypothetical protein